MTFLCRLLADARPAALPRAMASSSVSRWLVEQWAGWRAPFVGPAAAFQTGVGCAGLLRSA